MDGDESAPWPSDDAEAAALSDAKERGDTTVAPKAKAETEEEEEPDTKNLPTVTQMVEKLPEPLKEKLDELFRARWVRVTRVRKKDLVR